MRFVRFTFCVVVAAATISVVGASTAEAHGVSRPACAATAHREMVSVPPHTIAQRGQVFRKCIAFGVSHVTTHKLERCAVLRVGPRRQWHLVRNACRIMVVWRFDYSDREAVTVAYCEGSLDPGASNGQYRGTFQMGTGERARWGHGPTVIAQTVAASDYYEYDRDVLGRGGWGPWQCAPGSIDNTRKWADAPLALVRYVYG